MSSRPVFLESLCLEADGETALTQLICRSIADTMWL